MYKFVKEALEHPLTNVPRLVRDVRIFLELLAGRPISEVAKQFDVSTTTVRPMFNFGDRILGELNDKEKSALTAMPSERYMSLADYRKDVVFWTAKCQEILNQIQDAGYALDMPPLNKHERDVALFEKYLQYYSPTRAGKSYGVSGTTVKTAISRLCEKLHSEILTEHEKQTIGNFNRVYYTPLEREHREIWMAALQLYKQKHNIQTASEPTPSAEQLDMHTALHLITRASNEELNQLQAAIDNRRKALP